MAKKPTPKRRQAKSKSRKRYSKFQFETRKRLKNRVHLVVCSNCQARRLAHHVCPQCGWYRGRQVIDMSSKLKDKIKKISA